MTRGETLMVVITDAIGRRWFHRSRWRTLTVGRAMACELVLPSSQVSRRHVHICLAAGGKHDDDGGAIAVEVTDLGSAGGTRLDGRSIDGRAGAEEGCVLEAGPFLLEVFVGGEPPPDATAWPHIGGSHAPMPPTRQPLGDDEPALTFRALAQWAPTQPIPIRTAVAVGIRLLEEIQRLHAGGKLAEVLPLEWLWVGKQGAVAIRPEIPPEMASGASFDRYASPERLDRPDVDVRSDVFAAGLVIYELLSGRHPFGEHEGKLGTLPLRGPFPDLRLARVGVLRELANTISTALEPCPDDRHGSVQAFIASLEVAIDESEYPASDEIEVALAPYFAGPAPASTASAENQDGASDLAVRVVIELEDDAGEKVEFLAKTREVSIGRHHTNDLVVLSLRMSRHHARFKFEEGRIIIEDLGSANGTFVNSQKVRRPTAVAVGDRIELGGMRVRFRVEAAAGPHLFVVAEHPERAPRRIAFHGRQKITIGSSPESEVELVGADVSARHARLIVWGERLQVEDLTEGKHTQLQGKPLQGTGLLSVGDIVEIGRWRLSASLDEWPDEEKAPSPAEALMLPSHGDAVADFACPGTLTHAVNLDASVPMFRTTAPRWPGGPTAQVYEDATAALRELRSVYLFPVVGGEVHGDDYQLDRSCLPGAPLQRLAYAPMPADVVLAVGEAVLEAALALSAAKLTALPATNLRARVDLRSVFVRADGRVLWLGVDLCREPEFTDEQLWFGVAPEQLQNQAAPVRDVSTLFGVGQLLYRLLTGRDPFVRSNDLARAKAILKDPPLDPREIVPAVPLPLVRALAAMLEKDPNLRLSSLDRALTELRGVRELISANTRPPILAMREWLKQVSGTRTALEAGPTAGHDEVTAKLRLPGATEEGPAPSRKP